MILTLTGASGAGKTTIARSLLGELPLDVMMVPSYTTRKPRDTDIEGEYKYVSELRFRFLKKINSFLWTVYPHGNSYGTTTRWVTKALRDDNTAYIMILTPDAVAKLMSFAEKVSCADKIFSFCVLSPTQEILRKRLMARGDKEEEIERRLADCVEWDYKAKTSGIPYEFVENNDTVESVTKEIVVHFLERFGDDWF